MGGYSYIVLYDNKYESGLLAIDLGAGHASPGETLTGRVITTLKQRALLNESPGAGYLERRWAEPFKKSGAWPISALRQAFLNGTLERVLEPDSYLRRAAGVRQNGDFGYASGQKGEDTRGSGSSPTLCLRKRLPSTRTCTCCLRVRHRHTRLRRRLSRCGAAVESGGRGSRCGDGDRCRAVVRASH